MVVSLNSNSNLHQHKTTTNDYEITEIDDPSESHFPALSQFIYAPISIGYTLPKILKADPKMDLEGSLDIALRIHRAHISFFYAATTLFSFIAPFFQIFHTINAFSKIKNVVTPALGIFLSIFEMVSEIISLKRVVQFNNKVLSNKNLNENIKYLKSEYFNIDTKEITIINEYTKLKYPHLERADFKQKFKEISRKVLQIKKCDLARRMRPWLAMEIEGKIPKLLKGLNSIDDKVRMQSLEEAKSLIASIDLQVTKRLLIHTIGLISLGFTITGLLLTLASGPFLPIFIILGVGGLLAGGRYLLSAGYLESRGWKFRLDNCVPTWVNKVYFQLFKTGKDKSAPALSNKA